MNSVRSKCFPNPYKDWGESESDVVKIDGDKVRIHFFFNLYSLFVGNA